MLHLLDLVKNSNYIAAFTGAGVSVESGIPDFRSSGGLYTSGDYAGHSPESILTKKMLRTNPRLVLKFYKERLMKMVDKEPNRSHIALKKLENCGKLKWIFSQNIDNLHQKAGSTNVLDLHGNSTQFKCGIECGNTYTYNQFLEKIEKEELPMCDCQFSYIRPNTVLFDECLNDEIFDKAIEEAQKCDLMLAIGSSLLVQPAASLLSEIQKTAKLVIINNDPTPYDKKAHLIINKNCGEVLEELIKELGI